MIFLRRGKRQKWIRTRAGWGDHGYSWMIIRERWFCWSTIGFLDKAWSGKGLGSRTGTMSRAGARAELETIF